MSGGGAASGGCEAAHHDVYAVLWTALFLFLTWLAGQCTGRVGLPPLAGEIVAGMVRACDALDALHLLAVLTPACPTPPQLLGPQLADLVPEPAALKLFGEFGLYLMCVPSRLSRPLRPLLTPRCHTGSWRPALRSRSER